jgi:hypothetical protein
MDDSWKGSTLQDRIHNLWLFFQKFCQPMQILPQSGAGTLVQQAAGYSLATLETDLNSETTCFAGSHSTLLVIHQIKVCYQAARKNRLEDQHLENSFGNSECISCMPLMASFSRVCLCGLSTQFSHATCHADYHLDERSFRFTAVEFRFLCGEACGR